MPAPTNTPAATPQPPGPAAGARPTGPSFPPGFQWGVSTSAYQIEGAADDDGRGRSIWDTFAGVPRAITDASTGGVACDHYHRMPEDVALLADLGVRSYRFSIAWPRIQPTGSGRVNREGAAFYDRLVDSLLAQGIAPLATLFHWDLPQPLQDAGGWQRRETSARFADYADAVANLLGDRVQQWITLNEASVHTELGHLLGVHAPGLTLRPELFGVVHHQMLAHGLAVAALRANGNVPVSIANSYGTPWAVGPDGTRATATDADRAAAAAFDAVHNRMYTDPILLGRYPDEAALLTAGGLDDIVLDGDLATISAPIDALGVNYYNPMGLGAPVDATAALPWSFRNITGCPRTAFDWPVVPDGLREMLLLLHEQHGDRLPPIWITENGCAVDDRPDADGAVTDDFRIDYLDQHLRAVRAAMDAGVDVRGYCVWSLLDNWEWAEGFTKRFGLVHVDYATQKRTPKASYHWYRDRIRAGNPRATRSDPGRDPAR
ncbi:MAG: beta-glucosidase [Dactylosporangium sp.]|nr:beta-glucosidase [Dactylosporangium sp.]